MSTDFEDRLRAAKDSLPKPDSTVSVAAEQRLLDSLPAAARERRWTLLPTRRTFLLAAALMLTIGAAGFGIGRWVGPSGAAATAAPEYAPGFVAAKGWNTVSTGLAEPPQAPTALAANVRFSTKDGEAEWVGNLPTQTINSLPTDGIVLVVTLYGDKGLDRYPTHTLPLQLSDASRTHGFEGVSLHIALDTIHARVDEWNVDVEVFFGASEPTSQQLADAQAELDRLVLPA